MGVSKPGLLRLGFDRRLKLEFHCSGISSDGGLLPDRQLVYGRLAGYEDVNDAKRLYRDAMMRAIMERKGLDRMATSSSQIGRFETAWLASEDNLATLSELLEDVDRLGTLASP